MEKKLLSFSHLNNKPSICFRGLFQMFTAHQLPMKKKKSSFAVRNPDYFFQSKFSKKTQKCKDRYFSPGLQFDPGPWCPGKSVCDHWKKNYKRFNKVKHWLDPAVKINTCYSKITMDTLCPCEQQETSIFQLKITQLWNKAKLQTFTFLSL